MISKPSHHECAATSRGDRAATLDDIKAFTSFECLATSRWYLNKPRGQKRRLQSLHLHHVRGWRHPDGIKTGLGDRAVTLDDNIKAFTVLRQPFVNLPVEKSNFQEIPM